MSKYINSCLGGQKGLTSRFQRISSAFSVQNLRYMSTNWNESSVITDRKSKFQARSIAITNSLQIPDILEQLVSNDKHIAKASHPHRIQITRASFGATQRGGYVGYCHQMVRRKPNWLTAIQTHK